MAEVEKTRVVEMTWDLGDEDSSGPYLVARDDSPWSVMLETRLLGNRTRIEIQESELEHAERAFAEARELLASWKQDDEQHKEQQGDSQ